MTWVRAVLGLLTVVLLPLAAPAAFPEFSLSDQVLVLPESPDTAADVSFQYLIDGEVIPRFAAPTEVALLGNDIVVDVFVESDPTGFLPISELQNVGPLPEGTYTWLLRIHDLDNGEIDVEERGEILVLDDPGATGALSLVMDARGVAVTDGSCAELPCAGPGVVSDAPAAEFETFGATVQLLSWSSSLFSSLASGPRWATLSGTSFTDGFSSPGTGRAVFDVLFRIPEALPYSITGDFGVDLPQIGNGITRFELRRVLTGQSFAPVFGFNLEGPFEERPVDEAGTLQPGLYQVLAIGAGCCGGADADWTFEVTIGMPPAPAPSVPSASGSALILLGVALAALGLAAARVPLPASTCPEPGSDRGR